MSSAGIYRLPPDQTSWALAALQAAGGTARTVESWQQDRMTALVLGAPPPTDGQWSPILPISQRVLAMGSGRNLSVGWLSSNQFAARMSTRRQSRSTADQWPTLLPELDALIAVHRDDVSMVRRWYSQVGFHPVAAIRCLYLEMEQPPASVSGRLLMRLIGPEQVVTWAPQMAQVHNEVFGHYGGTLVRYPEFWQATLAHHYYREHYQFQILGLWAEGPAAAGTGITSDPNATPGTEILMGYAVVGWSGWHSKWPRMDILELATRQWDRRVAEELIATTCQLAWSKNVHDVRAVLSVHDPYRAHLVRTGFEDRWGYTMSAKWLAPQRYLDRVGAELGKTYGVSDRVQLSIPGQVDLSIPLGGHSTPTTENGGGRIVRVQTNEAAATRLLLGRLELPNALREGQMLALDASESDLTRLAMTLPWTPWAFHMLDYI